MNSPSMIPVVLVCAAAALPAPALAQTGDSVARSRPGLGSVARPSMAQTPGQTPASVLTYDAEQVTARNICPTKCGLHTDGTLVADSSRRIIEFDRKGVTVATVPYDRVAAIHWEASKFPLRWLHHETYYLTVEYAGTDGQRTALCVRLASNVGQSDLLDALGRETGRPADTEVSSLVGPPLYARLALDNLQGPPAFGSLQSSVKIGTEVSVEVSRGG